MPEHSKTSWNENNRRAAAEHAGAWTRAQAARLETTPAVILEAVSRGWLPSMIEDVTSRYTLEDVPLSADLRDGAALIRTAPVTKVRRTKRMTAFDDYEKELATEKKQGPTAMALAMHNAK